MRGDGGRRWGWRCGLGGGLAGWMEKRGVGGGGFRLGFTGRTPRRVQPSLDLCFSLLSPLFAGSVSLQQDQSLCKPLGEI